MAKRQKRKPLTKKRLVKLYMEKGYSLSNIQDFEHIGYHDLKDLLVKYGIPIKKPGYQYRGKGAFKDYLKNSL